MTQRGRKGVASLSVIQGMPKVERPEPPQELRKAEAVEWRAIVGRMPADWFPRETHAMLIELCRCKVRANEIDRKSHKRAVSAYDWRSLVRLQQQNAAMILQLCTKMRITQSSFYDERKSRASKSAGRPWDDD